MVWPAYGRTAITTTSNSKYQAAAAAHYSLLLVVVMAVRPYANHTMSAQPQVHAAHHELRGAGMYIPTHPFVNAVASFGGHPLNWYNLWR